MGKFCMNCGKELDDNIRFCSGCGAAVGDSSAQTNQSQPNNQGVPNNQSAYNNNQGTYNQNNFNAQNQYYNAYNANTPRNLLHTLSDRYKINAIIWFIIAGIQVILGITINWILLIVLMQPQGIVNKEKPLAMPIVVTVYNVFFGGLIGIAGSIYYLVGIRNFVMTNANAFMALEQQPQRTF